MDGLGAAHCAARRAVGDSSSASSQHGVGGSMDEGRRTGGWKLGGKQEVGEGRVDGGEMNDRRGVCLFSFCPPGSFSRRPSVGKEPKQFFGKVGKVDF